MSQLAAGYLSPAMGSALGEGRDLISRSLWHDSHDDTRSGTSDQSTGCQQTPQPLCRNRRDEHELLANPLKTLCFLLK